VVNENIRQLAEELRKQKKFAEATVQYEILWSQSRTECSEWDGWGYAFCLRKTNETKKALDICREVYKLKPDFEQIRSLYGWCIYDLEIKKSDKKIKDNEAEFFRAAKAIMELTSPGQFSPYIRTIFRIIDYLKKSRQNYPAGNILVWLDRISPDMLSTECGTGKDEDGKIMEYASDLEKWYSEKCKALFKIRQYGECINIGQEAVLRIDRFHTNNDVWIQYRIALARGYLGEKDESIKNLKILYSKKKDWFIPMGISKMYFDLADFVPALKYASEAALAPGPKDLSARWGLYMHLGKVLLALEKQDEAKDHVLLAYKLRKEKGWKEIAGLSTLITQLKVNLSDERSVNRIQKNLTSCWKKIVYADKKQISGKVKNLVGKGRSGFITGDDGQDYYFKITSFQNQKEDVKPGAHVIFYVQSNPDERCDSAIDIELA